MFNGERNITGRCVPRAVDSQLQVHIISIIIKNWLFIVRQTRSCHMMFLVNRYNPLLSWHAR